MVVVECWVGVFGLIWRCKLWLGGASAVVV